MNARTDKKKYLEKIPREGDVYLSIVIPVFNEEDNIEPLYQDLKQVLNTMDRRYEVIFVDDGSADGSFRVLKRLAERDESLRIIQFRRNFGQTAAMSAGIEFASGDVIIPVDGDNQNDPEDIPRLLDKIEEGYDVVSGWRRNREDRFITRILPSKIANWLISKISGVRLHDYGCTLKAYKKEVIKDVKLYGEMHRFVPIYASWQGANVTEMIVKHRPRKFGKSKYGISRTFRVILDLVLIKFLERYSQNPIHLFGGFGLLNFLLSFISFVLMIYYKFWGGKSFIQTPLPQLVVLFFLMGFLSILIGFIAEILMRTYYESQNKRVYSIKDKLNLD